MIINRRDFLKTSSLAVSASMMPFLLKRKEQGELSFAILSDLHFPDQVLENYETYRNIINELNVDFMVLNGDNLNDDGKNIVNGKRNWERFGNNYDTFYKDYLLGFNPEIDIYPVMGNHDPFFPGRRNMNIMADLMKEESFLFHHNELVRKCTKGKYNKEFYSWDKGEWHFLSLPCGGTEYLQALNLFEWIDEDLRKNRDKPVIVFMHVPPLSIGMTDTYFINVEQKKLFLDLFSKYGNVKYVFTGHIHNSTKVSIRSARNYEGTNYIVCPTHIYSQRPFGKNQKYDKEYEFKNHGFIIGFLKKNQAELYSIMLDKTRIAYPDKFESFTYSSNPVNFYPLQSLPQKEEQGCFRDKSYPGWFANYVYNEEDNPSYVRQIVSDDEPGDKKMIHLILKGRANPYNDFQRLGQSNGVYKYFNQAGKLNNTRLSLNWKINEYNLAEKDLSAYPNPYNNKLRAGFFKLSEYYNAGLITFALLKNNLPVFQYDGWFGKWEKGPFAQGEPDPKRFLYRFSVFDYGNWNAPENRLSEDLGYNSHKWNNLELNLSDKRIENKEFDRALLSLLLANDGMAGNIITVHFGDIQLLTS
jgi:predicted MPP superfamily phosphohydrolase